MQNSNWMTLAGGVLPNWFQLEYLAEQSGRTEKGEGMMNS